MAQRDGYQIDGRDLGNYYWTGAKGERRAASSAYADAKAPDNYYDNKNYMRDVGRGGELYDQQRMRQDADAEDERIQRRQPTRVVKRTPPKSARRK
jgi:hypothetical protein